MRQLFSVNKKQKRDLTLAKFLVLKFGYKPKDISFFHEALTHKSIMGEQGIDYCNERLEFLGDAILDAVIADLLYEKFPEENEGFLTTLKSKLVSRTMLAKLGEDLEILPYIKYKKGRTINTSSLQGNAFEALIGAIYLDSDYDTVKNKVMYHLFRYYINLNRILNEEVDFKSKLLIWAQKNRLEITFEIVKEDNLGSHWEYESVVKIGEKDWGKGTGTSKKMAEQIASKETLILLGEL